MDCWTVWQKTGHGPLEAGHVRGLARAGCEAEQHEFETWRRLLGLEDGGGGLRALAEVRRGEAALAEVGEDRAAHDPRGRAGVRPAEQRLPVTAQLAGAFAGPGLAAVRGQQAGDERHQFPGNVKSDTIGDHAEPRPVADDLQRDLFYRGLRAFPGMPAYVRVPALMPRYALFAGFTLAEKTSVSITSQTTWFLRHPVIHIKGQKGQAGSGPPEGTCAPQTTFHQAKHPNLTCNTPQTLHQVIA